MLQRNPVGSSLSVGGIVAIAFSVAVGMLVLFSPIACTFVGSLLLLILGVLFVIGGFTLLFGRVLLWKQRKVGSNPGGVQ